jgi:MazG family protein
MDERHARELDDLRRLVARLRAPDGCPWDREQTLAAMRSHLLEEAHEVAAAIDGAGWTELGEELGDLLFQVAFLLQLGVEAGALSTAEVVAGVARKMVERHPHVFDDGEPLESAEQVERTWARRKRRQGGSESVLAGVASTLPALVQADRLTRKAAGVGFDWDDADGVLAKLDEEMRELRDSLAARSGAPGGDAAVAEEVGDLLFTAANLARHLGIDAEAALIGTNGKFRRRFEHLERVLTARGHNLEEATREEMEEAWQDAKRLETT